MSRQMSLSKTLKMNAYAAVIGAATRLQGGHRPMPEEVEYAKPPVTDDPLYNDSHYFNFFDHDHGIGAFTRIGKLANQVQPHATGSHDQCRPGFLYRHRPVGVAGILDRGFGDLAYIVKTDPA